MHSPTLESARAHAAQLAVDEDEEDDEEGLRPGHEQQSASQSRRPSLGPSRHIERQKAIPDLSHISDVIPTETKTDLQGKEEDETNFTFGEQQQQHERHQQAQNGDPNSIVINEKNKFILPSFLPFTPQTVLKLRDGDGNDIFINVSKSDALQDDSFVVSKNSPLRSDDKQGNASSIYDVCIAAVTKLNDEKVHALRFLIIRPSDMCCRFLKWSLVISMQTNAHRYCRSIVFQQPRATTKVIMFLIFLERLCCLILKYAIR